LDATTAEDEESNSRQRQQSVRMGTTAIQQVINTATGAAKALFVSAYNDFRFKDFCSPYFSQMRCMCGIVDEDYATAFESTCKESFSEGRSGAFMFLSADQRFIVKTTSKQDMAALYRIIPKYVEYLKSNPNSLIVRFLGAHSIKMYGVNLYFVVMLNVFPKFPLSERYDLKGSWVNRHGFNGNSKKTRSEMMVRREQPSSPPLYQDNDLQHKISLQPEVIKPFVGQIKKDAEFLRGATYLFHNSVPFMLTNFSI